VTVSMTVPTTTATRHIILISGKDSLATAIVQTAYQPDLPYELVFNPTGAELPEVYEWIDAVAAYLGRPIVRVGRSLEEVIAEQGILPSQQARYCTKYSKIFPLEDYLGADETVVYYGLRHDEPERVGYQRKSRGRGANIRPAYPLRMFCLGLNEVWRLVESRGLLPPAFFWRELHERVVARLGSFSGIIDTLAPWEHRQAFAWRSRPNCSHCFFQRRYEWAGLLAHHPDLFWKAEAMEREIGGEGFTWIRGLPLAELAGRADEYLEKRVGAVVKMLYRKAQLGIWHDEGEEVDGLGLVSCGLYCGK
jgi:3'-phosphoadenosine 5'-phosphosulfate sulfotransferase (PAPS reductase)/FAD synthetase